MKHWILPLLAVPVIALTIAALLFAQESVAPEKDDTSVSVGWVGDMVPSIDTAYNMRAFDAVSSYLQTPDLMIGNLEGTFAIDPSRISKCNYILSKCHAFAGDPSFADSLKANGFDFVSLVNNHSYDFGDDGLDDTTRELDRVGIPYVSPKKPTEYITVKGKRIGILGLSSTPPLESITDYDFIERTVSELSLNSDYVIVIFHGGAEGSDKTTILGTYEYVGDENRGNVQEVAQRAIDAGADLVLGAGPHVLRPIETYNGKTIAYSLGNFVTGKKLLTGGTLSESGIFFKTFEEEGYSFLPVTINGEGLPEVVQ